MIFFEEGRKGRVSPQSTPINEVSGSQKVAGKVDVSPNSLKGKNRMCHVLDAP